MAKLFLHVGMEKTGSTAFQTLLARNREALSGAGITFPALRKGASNHNFLASAYLPPEDRSGARGLGTLAPEARAAHLAGARETLLAHLRRHDRAILSGEHLFRLDAGQIGRLADDLAAAGVTECRVLGVLRAPAAFYLSFAQQEVKGTSRLPSIDLVVPYADRVAAWQARFDTRFLSFDAVRGQLVATCVRALTDFFGPVPGLPDRIGALNETFSPEEMQILQDYRRANFPDQEGSLNRDTSRMQRLLRAMRDDRWHRPVLRPEVAEHLAARHAEQARRLEALTGIVFPPAPGLPPALDARDYVLASQITANFDADLHREILARIAHELIRDPLFRLRLNWRRHRQARADG